MDQSPNEIKIKTEINECSTEVTQHQQLNNASLQTQLDNANENNSHNGNDINENGGVNIERPAPMLTRQLTPYIHVVK